MAGQLHHLNSRDERRPEQARSGILPCKERPGRSRLLKPGARVIEAVSRIRLPSQPHERVELLLADHRL
jgi:hypothetical protein